MNLTKRPKLAILELYQHFEVLRPLLDQVDVDRMEVQVFVQATFKKQYDAKKAASFYWHVFDEPRLHRSWFDQIGNLKQYDLVLVLTATSHFTYFNRILKGTNYYYLVHNVTPTFHRRKWSFKGATFRDILSGAKYFMQSHGIGKLLENANGIFFLNDQVISWLSPNITERYSIVSGPPIFYRNPDKVQSWFPDRSNKLNIVVPGTLKARGRDYHQLRNALIKLPDRILSRMHLVLLGTAESDFAKKWLRSLQVLRVRGLQVTSFSKPLTMKSFDQYFRSAHLCICLFRKWYRLGWYRDEFGKQSISGVINDLIYFGTAALAPSFHPFPQELENQVIRYCSTSDLTKKIQHFFKQGKSMDQKSDESYEKSLRADALNQWLCKRISP